MILTGYKLNVDLFNVLWRLSMEKETFLYQMHPTS